MAEIIDQLAALRFYHAKGTTKIPFETLSEDGQAPFRADAASILTALEKLNLMLVAKVTTAEAEAAQATRLQRCLTRAQTVLDHVTLWNRAAFPLKELVLQCLAEADHAR